METCHESGMLTCFHDIRPPSLIFPMVPKYFHHPEAPATSTLRNGGIVRNTPPGCDAESSRSCDSSSGSLRFGNRSRTSTSVTTPLLPAIAKISCGTRVPRLRPSPASVISLPVRSCRRRCDAHRPIRQNLPARVPTLRVTGAHHARISRASPRHRYFVVVGASLARFAHPIPRLLLDRHTEGSAIEVIR